MRQKESIRNVGIIAHIDHGKTTLADALLAGAGLLSPTMAGTARVLDYLEEEQKRKITIKTANITLLHKTAQASYVINLVDTPGHVDFTGRVTRALRAIDGAVVVVDAVEEIMAQTETVTRQALEERVRPVLFINKVDRLITELHLNAEGIEKKLTHIINSFNDLIELHGETPLKEQWKVDPATGSVAFGSALHGWGFTLAMARQKGVRFADIADLYAKSEQDSLKKVLPVHDAVFAMAVKSIPNPRVAQVYRVERIWDGVMKSEAGLAMADCSDEGPTVICVTNVQADPDVGMVAAGRVFSGTVKKGDRLHLVEALGETDVRHVYVSMGSFREEVDEVSAGNLAALAVSDAVKAGETLVDVAHKAGMVPFEGITYVSEPVVTVAVEPKNPENLQTLLEAMRRLEAEDPNLLVEVNEETGEYLLSGMGELHLEVALNQLKAMGSGLEIVESSPRVVYRETVTKQGAAATASSPNRQNRFTVRVEPLQEEMPQDGKVHIFKEDDNILSVDEHRNVLLDCSRKTENLEEETLESVIAGFEFACRAGPLCGENMRHVRVHIQDLQLSEKAEFRSPTEIMHAVGKAIFGSFLTAEPVLLEPVYRTVFTLPAELAGECSRIVTTRRGKIKFFEQKGASAVITAFIPVAETFGLSRELRSMSSGRALWQNLFDRWERMPEKLAAKVITETRRTKGLSPEVPPASKFMEETGGEP